MSNKFQTLQNVASVNDFLTVTVIETAPLLEHLEFEFLLVYEVLPPLVGGEHE